MQGVSWTGWWRSCWLRLMARSSLRRAQEAHQHPMTSSSLAQPTGDIGDSTLHIVEVWT